MPLEDRAAFAARCGTSLQYLKFVGYKVKPCSLALAIAIERESAGRVRVETLRPDVPWHVIRSRSKCACLPRQAGDEAAA